MDAASKAEFHRLHDSRIRGLSRSRSRVRGHSDSLVTISLSSRSSHAGFQSPSWVINLLKRKLRITIFKRRRRKEEGIDKVAVVAEGTG